MIPMKHLIVFFALAAFGMVMPGTVSAEQKTVIAHRGASGYLPEHTLAAKAMAHGMGVEFIEQDLVLTKDGVPVVLHDIHLDTVTDVAEKFPGRARKDGRYFAIDFTLAEIKTLSVSERFDRKTGKAVYPSRFPLGGGQFAVPTFEEEITLIKGLNASTGRAVGIYPEIKSPAFHRSEGQDISQIVITILKKHGYTSKSDQMIVQCFDWNETQRLRGELGYEGRLVQLIGENKWKEAPDVDFEALRTPEGLAKIAKVADGIGPWIPHVITGKDADSVTGLVAGAHGLGLKVHPYTARADSLPKWAASLDELLQAVLVTADADGIFTDFPDQAVAWRNLDMSQKGAKAQ